MHWLAVALGGALGSVVRFAAVSYLTPLLNLRFPVGTFTVNLIGSFLIGVAYVVLVEKAASSEWQLFFMTGILGGFTTFSAFSLDTMQLWQSGHGSLALLYVVGSVAMCLVAVAAGVLLSQKLF